MTLTGCAAIPAPLRERRQMAYFTGRRAVELVLEDLRPSGILTREAFENAIVAASALGTSTNCPRINEPALAIDENCLLFVRNTGPVGNPGAAEVVNMLPPDALVRQGITLLPCLGDGRQSGTSGSPSILNASPEAAVGGGLALLRTGDRVRIDLPRHNH